MFKIKVKPDSRLQERLDSVFNGVFQLRQDNQKLCEEKNKMEKQIGQLQFEVSCLKSLSHSQQLAFQILQRDIHRKFVELDNKFMGQAAQNDVVNESLDALAENAGLEFFDTEEVEEQIIPAVPSKISVRKVKKARQSGD